MNKDLSEALHNRANYVLHTSIMTKEDMALLLEGVAYIIDRLNGVETGEHEENKEE